MKTLVRMLAKYLGFSHVPYIRMVLVLCVAVTLFFVPFVYIMSNLFSKYALDEVNRFTAYKADKTAENIDFILLKLKLYATNIYNDQSIQQFLTATENDPIVNKDAGESLTTFIVNEPFIRKAYLTNSKLGRLLDSESGILSFSGFNNQQLLNDFLRPNPTYMNFTKRSFGIESSIMLSLPTGPHLTSTYGRLVIFLNKSIVENYVLKDDPEMSVFVVDSSGEAIFGSLMNSRLLSRMEEIRSIPQLEINDGSASWIVTSRQLDTEPWHLIIVHNKAFWNKQVLHLQNTLLTTSLLVLSLLLLIIFVTSKKTFQPLNVIMARVKRSFGKEVISPESDLQQVNDYVFLEKSLDYLEDTIHSINSKLREHKPLIKEEFLKMWLIHGYLNESSRKYMLQETSLLQAPFLFISVFRIDGYYEFCQTYNFSSRKLLKYAIGNIVEEVMLNHGMSAYAIDLGGDHLIMLQGSDNDDPGILKQPLEKSEQVIASLLHLSVVIGLSDAKTVHADFKFNYEHVYELTQLKFLTGIARIYFETDYEAFLGQMEPLEFDTLQIRLIQAIKLGKETQAIEILNEVSYQLQTIAYQDRVFRLKLLIFAILTNFSYAKEMHSFEGLNNLIERFSTLQQLLDWLEIEIMQIIHNMHANKAGGRRAEMADEIVDYIQSNLSNPALSIDDLANHMGYSAGHIREIFREALNQSLVEYITSERIKKIKILLASTDRKVSEIAEYCGFQTKSHFYAAFKKEVGVTPNEYRELNVARVNNQ